MLRPDGEAGSLRAGLLLLVVLGVVGTALALAYDRHWQTPLQFPPWITLGVISVAWVALVVRPRASTVWAVRAVAVLTIVVAMLGVWQHANANYQSGPSTHDHATGHASTSADSAADDADGAADDASSSGHHHGDDEDAASDGHHQGDEEDASSAATESAATEMASSDVTLMDAMTGSAGRAPVPAALAIVPVGLALALATIGVGGRQRLSDD